MSSSGGEGYNGGRGVGGGTLRKIIGVLVQVVLDG